MSLPSRRLQLKPAARRDLEKIWAHSRREWGQAQADAYVTQLSDVMRVAAANPDQFRIEMALTPVLRIAFAGSHVILFRETPEGIEVIRIRHQREDWRG